MNRIGLAILFALLYSFAFSQNPNDFLPKSDSINRYGMFVLGSWAITNMAIGGYGTLKYQGEKKYFHQMNLMWNIVNAGIATFALYQLNSSEYSQQNFSEQMSKHMATERLYLINAGLDIVYIAGGAFLIRASKKSIKNGPLLKGYGQSVVLQGGFLFLFDMAMYAIQYDYRVSFSPIVDLSDAKIIGLSLCYSF